MAIFIVSQFYCFIVRRLIPEFVQDLFIWYENFIISSEENLDNFK